MASYAGALAGLRGFTSSLDRGRRDRFEEEDRAAIREDRTMRRAEYERNSQLAGLQQEIATREAGRLRDADKNDKSYKDAYFNTPAGAPRTVSVADTVDQNSVGLGGGIGGREAQTVSRDITSTPAVSRIDRIDSVMEAARQNKDYTKFAELEALKPKMMDEGIVQALKVRIRGGSAQEIAATMNEYGSRRVVPESAKIDAEGNLTGIDAGTGQPLKPLNLTELETFFSKELGLEKQALINVAEGGSVFDPRTKKELFNNPKTEDPSKRYLKTDNGYIDPRTGQSFGQTDKFTTNSQTGEVFNERTGLRQDGKPVGAAGRSEKQIEHTDARVKIAIDKAIMPYFGGKFEGGAYFPDEANKDAALEAVTRAERYVGSGMEPIAAGQRAVQEVQRDRTVDGAAPKTDPKFADKVKNIMGGKSGQAAKPANSASGQIKRPGQKSAPTYQEGKTYKDSTGNRAVYRNGKFQAVQ